MNEFDMVRTAFPPEPDGLRRDVAATTRNELQAMGRKATNRRRQPIGRVKVGLALTACGALVALGLLGLPLLSSGEGAAQHPGVIGVVPDGHTATADQVLVSAAVRQEQQATPSGKYFRTRWLETIRATRVGRPASNLERRRITETWVPAQAGAAAWLGLVDLGLRPARPSLDKLPPDNGGDPAFPEGRSTSWTVAEINALPTDVVQLRTRLLAGLEQPAEADRYVFQAAARLLFETPASPQLRGAALRVLAAIPGIQMRTGVSDPIGRKGTEFALSTAGPANQPGRASIIIDTSAGTLLSSTYDAKVKASSSVLLEAGWTDRLPQKPSTAVR
ncbi:hypothetical protein GCM10029976_079010 [Kribbella albertanoniae]|uniref:CU044_5270 family protein n=1 Tax=Kribbella albertanoniae TaxID=1266829 RepID=A0A4R4QA64_9ACTN|nr:CU044_5270 family protein [Kribbella albertanoniae]TDC32187.1 hypothetical protein E1261_09110 [Kribbella albertanoniae]